MYVIFNTDLLKQDFKYLGPNNFWGEGVGRKRRRKKVAGELIKG